MDSHPHEYGIVALVMGGADLLERFLVGQAAFIASPEFQKRLEDMIDTDSVNVGELVDILHQSGFAEKVLTNPSGMRTGRSTDCLRHLAEIWSFFGNGD